ncbi:hypothetical protein SAMN05216227_103224 [Pseudorhodobacter antarcticus]|jgi:hypothetical protein|uniref:Uncharacterized protein n=1 Tax=Pseudorhodobacter antarcticus TaxID=1077947 RepID=A0A1H8KIJ7_9RHOB|nr:hypothetical protein [Pseudorhodobacter antarcticus]SEN92705.1 hypothetical protein SAMN05216227_103224 [Pseudorhodobacter antarcticus]
MTFLLSHPLVPVPTTGDWMTDRLTEARGVLADTTQHPDSLVILAARVVVGQTGDASECADAIDLLRLLDRRPLHAIAAAAFPKGGVA